MHMYQPSPSIQTPNDLTIEAWVYLNQYKNDTYNNIVIEAVTTTASLYPNRTVGFAINGYVVNGTSSPELGALRGYVTTDTGGFNEIDTTTAACTKHMVLRGVYSQHPNRHAHLC